MKFFSQFQEDEFIVRYCERYGIKLHPVAIEIGASNGLDLSNIRHFCLEKGFKGIYVEPHPERFKELLVNTQGQDAVCINSACVSNCIHPLTLSKVMFKLESNPDFSHLLTEGSGGSDEIAVNTIDWFELISISKENIGIASIDVEGCEIPILHDLIESSVRPQFIIIESNKTTLRDNQIRRLVNGNYMLHKMKDKNTLWMDGNLLTEDQDNAIYDVK